jgi:acyl carrier protein
VPEPQDFEPEKLELEKLEPEKLNLAAAGYSPDALQTWLVQWIAEELKTAIATIEPHKSFVHYGMDSVTAIMLISDLEVELGCQLSPALAWNYPVIADLAKHLAELMTSGNRTPVINPEQLLLKTPAIANPAPELANGHNPSVPTTPESTATGSALLDSALPNLDQLSDQEVDALLSQMLNAQEHSL